MLFWEDRSFMPDMSREFREISFWIMSPGEQKSNRNRYNQRDYDDSISSFVVYTVPADYLAKWVARAPADLVWYLKVEGQIPGNTNDLLCIEYSPVSKNEIAVIKYKIHTTA